MHGVAGSLSVSALPDKHVAQVVWLVEEKEPLGQGSHGVDGSASVSAVPLGHASHVFGVAKPPGVQLTHGVLEMPSSSNRPPPQGEQVVAPAAPKVSVALPAPQVRHADAMSLS